MKNTDKLVVAVSQMAPVWLDKKATMEKVIVQIRAAAGQGAQLICFGETLLPGYPFWPELTGGAIFESDRQKDIYAHYLKEAIAIGNGELEPVCAAAREGKIAIYIGCVERAIDRGGHSVYCSLVYIDEHGDIQSIHRKLMPTYEERLVWATGDGHGLRVHQLEAFTLGGLNCWENWMPLVRASLYAQGENLHVATWPGSLRNTVDLTRHIALESRSYVISVCGLMRKEDIGIHIPHHQTIRDAAPELLANGGSCISNPDGTWLMEPVVGEEVLRLATLDFNEVRRARHNFDPNGHYSRPDVVQLKVNRERQVIWKEED